MESWIPTTTFYSYACLTSDIAGKLQCSSSCTPALKLYVYICICNDTYIHIYIYTSRNIWMHTFYNLCKYTHNRQSTISGKANRALQPQLGFLPKALFSTATSMIFCAVSLFEVYLATGLGAFNASFEEYRLTRCRSYQSYCTYIVNAYRHKLICSIRTLTPERMYIGILRSPGTHCYFCHMPRVQVPYYEVSIYPEPISTIPSTESLDVPYMGILDTWG